MTRPPQQGKVEKGRSLGLRPTAKIQEEVAYMFRFDDRRRRFIGNGALILWIVVVTVAYYRQFAVYWGPVKAMVLRLVSGAF